MRCVTCFVAFLAFTSIDGNKSDEESHSVIAAWSLASFGYRFTFDIMNKSTESFVFSPYAVNKGVILLYTMARGSTKLQIAWLFGRGMFHTEEELYTTAKLMDQELTPSLAKDITFRYGSYALFCAQQLNQTFVNWVKKELNTEIIAFRTTADINRAVDTINQRILRELSSPNASSLTFQKPNPFDVGLLYNYVFLKANWAVPFPLEKTRLRMFTWTERNRKHQASIPMMHHTSSKFLFDRSDKYTTVGIPFKGEKLALFILVNNGPKGLQEAWEDTLPDLVGIAKKTYKTDVPIKVTIPKFELFVKNLDIISKFQNGYDNVSKPFTKDVADFSNVVPRNNVFINSIQHKAFLKIDENGADADKVEADVERETNCEYGDERIQFKANRPFLFFVADRRSGAILLQGIYQKPSSY